MEAANLVTMLDGVCTTFPANKSIIYGDKEITYEELNRAVNSFGNKLKGMGIQKGDKVTIMLPNIPEFVISYFAIIKLGAVAVTVNSASTPYELSYLLDNSDSKAFITVPSSAKRFQEIRENLPQCRYLIVTEGSDGDFSIENAAKEGPFELSSPSIDGDDPAVMVYTAGLTGKPLGAVLTHHNLYTQSLLIKEICSGTEHDNGLCLIPLFHTFGASVNMLCALHIGGTMVMMDKFNLEHIFRTIERRGITYISAVPRVYLGMLLYEKADTFDVSTLRLCITGGSTIPPEYITMFEEKFKIKLMEGYGLTEASPVCTFSRPQRKQKPGSIGITVTDVKAKILDDEGNELPIDEEGELVIQGPNVMRGYYKDEEKTAEVIKEGWLHTGDLAKMDKDGDIFLTGRKKRMVITSGFNVYPKEIETILDMHPGVAASRITAKEDLMRGEIVKALIVTKDHHPVSDKEIMRHCRQYLSSYKVPREIEFVDSLE